jgi:DNA-binding MarR family transcriptional regulator
MNEDLPLSVTHEVRDHCLCLHVQRAARAVARRFDEAFKPFGLTNGQFSLLVALNRPDAPRLGDVARLLAMDRTTLTASIKPLERRGLVRTVTDTRDRRSRHLALTDDGRVLLIRALPVWRDTHADLDTLVRAGDPGALRADLLSLAFGQPERGGEPARKPE